MSTDLAALPTKELVEMAYKKRQESFGHLVTYSPKAFFPLTMLCRDRCGYCTFAKAPANIKAPYMTLAEIRELGVRARSAGCREALFTLGEKPELRYKTARTFLESQGYRTTTSYLEQACRVALRELDLLPHPNAGALSKHEMASLKEVSVSQGMMLESLRGDLAAHRLAPDKAPKRRLDTIKFAGELKIPFTTGLLVGIGETEQDRVRALTELARLHNTYGHIQEVIVQNFVPKAATAMAHCDSPSQETHIRAVALARLLMPGDVHIQVPPNLTDELLPLMGAGADDLGGISPITVDHVNPERPWPEIEIIAKTLSKMDLELVPRTPVHPNFVNKDGFVSDKVKPYLLRHIDSEGYAREDEFFSGVASEATPKIWLSPERSRVRHELKEVFDTVLRREDLDESQIKTLFLARGGLVREIAALADEMRKEIIGDDVTFVMNRNINYTNICTFRCRFCAFSKGPMSLNLRGNPYLLSNEQILDKVGQAAEAGATEVCLQGGIHPKFNAEYYVSLIESISRNFPLMHIHAFSALEVLQGATRSNMDIRDYLTLLHSAGLKTLPGTAAEILDEPVRQVLCPDKLSTSQWLEVHEIAHEVGLRSNVTIMFGSVEDPSSWVRHIARTRDLQRRTGGFTEFVPLPFVHMGSPIYLKGSSRRGPTFRETVLMHAVGRLAYANSIRNIQVSWVKLGAANVQTLLRSGANDLGGTLMEESISHAAGSEHANMLSVREMHQIVSPLQRRLKQRSTLYEIVNENPQDNEYYAQYARHNRVSIRVKVD